MTVARSRDISRKSPFPDVTWPAYLLQLRPLLIPVSATGGATRDTLADAKNSMLGYFREHCGGLCWLEFITISLTDILKHNKSGLWQFKNIWNSIYKWFICAIFS